MGELEDSWRRRKTYGMHHGVEMLSCEVGAHISGGKNDCAGGREDEETDSKLGQYGSKVSSGWAR